MIHVLSLLSQKIADDGTRIIDIDELVLQAKIGTITTTFEISFRI